MSYRGRGNNDRFRQDDRPGQNNPRKRPAADVEEDRWVAEEDKFVLRQAKRRAILRVRGGRAKPIDWLAVVLRSVDKTMDFEDETTEEGELDIVDPEGVFEGLDAQELADLKKDIDSYLDRETNSSNKEFWSTMKVICVDRLSKLKGTARGARGVGSISADVDRMFSNKTFPELEKLEGQIRGKLNSDEDIDVDYWEHLLQTLLLWKAKAKLKSFSQDIVKGRLMKLRQEQIMEAEAVRKQLGAVFSAQPASTGTKASQFADPEPLLKIRAEDKGHEVVDETEFLQKIMDDRRKVLKLGYVPMKAQLSKQDGVLTLGSSSANKSSSMSNSASGWYQRMVARGVEEDEEMLTTQEPVETTHKAEWADKYEARNPEHFNRVRLGYEWNKYNQTHYDIDNPPPKVVQGYKFNMFYPDLVDKAKAPTYKIEREGGRKRGQTFAPAGEEDTCLIRFIAGAPYNDVAFRIVDREWDYSSKRERGFKSSFEQGILQLHFQFKKIYYRK
ncbi:hypothetical protein BT63DRAFT_434092 [Microthyrium microscopicum]|uniref:Splicing factor Cactin n=1 Tax=Microthyrium microscopicum TaxID=703497 RepID=A0A6A6U1N8_9PEZI|nr:hypothetical protein BT63DRAFT_434092 [Microthyrium microscopicum]